MLDELLNPAEPSLYSIATDRENRLVGMLLAVACRPASPAVLADGVGGRGENATYLPSPALPAALGALANLSTLGVVPAYLGISSSHFL